MVQTNTVHMLTAMMIWLYIVSFQLEIILYIWGVKCDKVVDFQKSGHICISLTANLRWIVSLSSENLNCRLSVVEDW